MAEQTDMGDQVRPVELPLLAAARELAEVRAAGPRVRKDNTGDLDEHLAAQARHGFGTPDHPDLARLVDETRRRLLEAIRDGALDDVGALNLMTAAACQLWDLVASGQ